MRGTAGNRPAPLNHMHEGNIMAEERTYELKEGTEFPHRFAGLVATYNVPSTLDEIRALIDDSVEDPDSVIVAGFNGQGYALSVQKRIKTILASDEVAEMTPEEAVAHAVQKASSEKIGAPRTRASGPRGKVAKAEAERDAAKTVARDMYARLSASQKKQFRPMLIEQGTFTEEELDEIDAA